MVRSPGATYASKEVRPTPIAAAASRRSSASRGTEAIARAGFAGVLMYRWFHLGGRKPGRATGLERPVELCWARRWGDGLAYGHGRLAGLKRRTVPGFGRSRRQQPGPQAA